MAAAKPKAQQPESSKCLSLEIDLDEFEIEVGTTKGTINIDSQLKDFKSSTDLNTDSLEKASQNPCIPLEDANDSLNKFLSAVADQLDAEAKAKDRSRSMQEEMENMTLGGALNYDDGEDNLTSLVMELKQNITPDWLRSNTAEKWQQENPDLAKEFIERMEQDKDKEY